MHRQFMGCVAAFLIASLFFYIVFSTFTFWQARSITFTVVLTDAVVLGLPVFLILWWRRWVNPGTCAGAGFVVAAVSGILRNWLSDLLLTLVFLGSFGALAGVVFWAILLASGVLPPSGNQNEGTGQTRDGAGGASRATALAAVALLIIGAAYLFAGPVLERIARMRMDRSCHNIVYDWDTTHKLSSRAYMILDLASQEEPKLWKAMEDFAAAHKLQFQGPSKQPVRWFASLCNDRLTIIASLYEISVLERQPDSGWQPTTKDLIDRVEALWPGRLRFRAPDGQYIPRPKELQ